MSIVTGHLKDNTFLFYLFYILVIEMEINYKFPIENSYSIQENVL